MGKHTHDFKKVLKSLSTGNFPKASGKDDEHLKLLQLRMLRAQQGVWHSRSKAVIVFEGFDAAGKGGAIRRLTEPLDPRGVHVHPIGPPDCDEKGEHYLQRFWQRLPAPGTIAIFDRSWYGRTLVERVEKLTPPKRIKQAYREINEFERMLVDDGFALIKIFLAISKKEQLARFSARLDDPYKQWKLTSDDVEARKHWGDYVRAASDTFERCSNPPWHIIAANDKDYTRIEVLEIVTSELKHHRNWIERKVDTAPQRALKKALKKLK